MATQGWLKFALRRVLPALAVLALLLASLKLAEDAAGGGGVGAVLPLDSRRGGGRARAARGRDRAAPVAACASISNAARRARASAGACCSCSCCSPCRRSSSSTDSRCAFSTRRSTTGSTSSSSTRSTTRSRSAASSSTSDCAPPSSRASALATQARTTRRPNELQASLDDEHRRGSARRSSPCSAMTAASSRPRAPIRAISIRRCPTRRCRCACRATAAMRPPSRSAILLMLRVAVPVGERRARRAGGLLQGLFPLPARLQTLTRGIENASFDFQRLKFLRGSLKLTFALILTFALLLSVAAGHARRVRRRTPARRAGRTIDRGDACGRRRPLRHAAADREQRRARIPRQFVRADDARDRVRERARAEECAARPSGSARGSSRCWNACRPACSASIATAACASRTVPPKRFSASAPTNYLGRSLAEIERDEPHLAAFTEPLARHLRGGLREWREELVVDTGRRPARADAARHGAAGRCGLRRRVRRSDRAQSRAARRGVGRSRAASRARGARIR